MYRNYEYNSEPLAQGSGQPSVPQRRRPKRPSFFQRVVALVLCAALFGGVAGGSFYGVNRLLGSLEPDSSDSGSSRTSSVSLTSLSYSSGDSSLDITDIAAQGLTSVGSVTNISVQEVQSYFGQFGRNGRTVHLDHFMHVSFGKVVDGLCHESLAGSRFSLKQYGGITWCNDFDLAENGLDGRTVADDVVGMQGGILLHRRRIRR